MDERQLGPLSDKDPEWRAGAVFTREEAITIISTPLISPDRQMVYALELLAGVRPGEGAGLRWRHYDPTIEPLGRLLVAVSYNTRKHREKDTKTGSVRHVPVHPTLAAMLAEWKLSGWAEMMGRSPEPDDLIVPLPPEAAARRRTREGEAFRGHDYSGKRWRQEDLPALGWRHRQHYDMKATFITLALDDGADPHVIETRVTHTKKSRSAFDGYNRGRQWEITCAEVSKLKLARRSASSEVIALAAGMPRYGARYSTRKASEQKQKMVEAAGVEISRDVNETERLLHDQELGVLSDPTGSAVIWRARAERGQSTTRAEVRVRLTRCYAGSGCILSGSEDNVPSHASALGSTRLIARAVSASGS